MSTGFRQFQFHVQTQNFWINLNFSPLSVQCALKKAHDKPGKKWPATRLVPHWKLKREIAMPATNSHFPERSEVKWPPTYEILIKSLPHLVGWKTEKECSTNVAGKTKGESQQMLLCYCSFNESPKVAKIKVHWPKNYKYISRSKVVLEHFKSLLMIIKLWFWKSWGLNHYSTNLKTTTGMLLRV